MYASVTRNQMHAQLINRCTHAGAKPNLVKYSRVICYDPTITGEVAIPSKARLQELLCATDDALIAFAKYSIRFGLDALNWGKCGWEVDRSSGL